MSTLMLMLALSAGAPLTAVEPGALPLGDAEALQGPLLARRERLEAADGAAFDHFGTVLALDGDTLAVGAPGDGTRAGAVYVFRRVDDGWTEEARLSAWDGTRGDLFGSSLDLDGDTLVVGAALAEVEGREDAGAAYVFRRHGDDWLDSQKLVATDGDTGDAFGHAVAIDGATVIVGAPGHRGGGAAFLFSERLGHWEERAKLSAEGRSSPQARFGTAVALDGGTLLIGASGESVDGRSQQGTVHVFERRGPTWQAQARLIAGDGAAGDLFGAVLAVDGDTALVGAPTQDLAQEEGAGAAPDVGAAYVFVRRDGVWQEDSRLHAPDGAANDLFASAVALEGGLAVIGAAGRDLVADAQGVAYLYARRDGVWRPQQRLFAADAGRGDLLGSAVALSGEVVVVGMEGDEVEGRVGQGTAAVFEVCAGPLTELQTLTPPDRGPLEGFGGALAIAGDWLAVGAATADGTRGAVYLFERDGEEWVERQQLAAGQRHPALHRALFGLAVALSGDWLLIGAPGERGGGAAYLFELEGGAWHRRQRLSGDFGARSFGSSVVIDGDTAVVAAPHEAPGLFRHGAADVGAAHVGAVYVGAVYVFEKDGGAWDRRHKLVSEDTSVDGASFGGSSSGESRFGVGSFEGSDLEQSRLGPFGAGHFGAALALEGSMLVVSEPRRSPGVVHVYERGATGWSRQQRLESSPQARWSFGVALALDGDSLAVGAPAEKRFGRRSMADRESGAPSQSFFHPARSGAVYLYARETASWQRIQKLTVQDLGSARSVGHALSLAGDNLVIGSPFGLPGRAYLYTRLGAEWSLRQELAPAHPHRGLDLFGMAVAIGGHSVLVGSPTDKVRRSPLRGSVRVFGCDSCGALGLEPQSLPDAAVDAAYEQQMSTDQGAPPVDFSLSSGALPTGLGLSVDGLLSGTPTIDGGFDFTVTAIDARQCSESRDYRLEVAPSNQPPVADAGADQTVTAGETVELDGTASFDPENEPLEHSWTLVSRPAASTAVLDDPTSASPAFVADLPGVYSLELVVSDGQLSSDPASTLVTAIAPLLTAAASDPDAAEAGPDPGAFTLSRSGALSFALTATYDLSGDATNGVDYASLAGQPLSGQVTFDVGSATAVVPLLPIDDLEVEDPESVVLTVLDAAAYDVGDPASATVVLVSDDLPVVSLTASDPTASEPGVDTGAFLVSRSGPTTGPLTVRLAISGSALNGTDYATLSPTLVLPAGDADRTLLVRPLNDFEVEGDENVDLAIIADPAYLLGASSSGSVVLADNDEPAEVFVVASDDAAEAGPDPGSFTVSRTVPAPGPLTVRYLLAGAAENGVDYATLPGNVTIPADEASAEVIVEPIDDDEVEGTEGVTLSIAPDPSYQVVDPGLAAVLIADDDLAVVTLEASDPDASEVGPSPGSITLARSGGLASDLVVLLSAGGGAENGRDYAALGGSTFVATIPAGQLSILLDIVPLADNLVEGPETAILTIEPDLDYVVGAASSAAVTIADDPPVLSVLASDPDASEAGLDPGVFTLQRSGGDLSAPLTALFAIGGTASNNSDYAFLGGTLALAAGETSATLTVRPLADLRVEGAETVTLTLRDTGAYLVGSPGAATVTIADDPTSVTLFATDPTAAEEGNDPGTITVRRTGGNLASPLPVFVARGPSSATNGVDYGSLGGSTFLVTIPAGAAQADIVIVPVDDGLVEGDETVSLTVGANPAYLIGSPNAATVVIADND